MLCTHFRHSPNVRVLHDADGEQTFAMPADFDVVICISVLHHIPDYLAFVRRLTLLLIAGGHLGHLPGSRLVPPPKPSRNRS